MTKREIHGFTHTGERIFLGSLEMSDDETQTFLDKIAELYADPSVAGWFNIRAAVFQAKAFAGVQITPPNDPA